MKEEKINITSEYDGLKLEGRLISPESEIKAVIQLVHGMNEHKERYIDFMRFLAQNGYACFIHDHRGHGASLKNEEDIGYFYDAKAEAVVEDAYQITKYLRNRFETKKIILFGHSMGSMVVRKYIAKYDDKIDGLIVCGSPSKNGGAKLGLAMLKVMKTVKGERYRSPKLKNLMFNGYDKNNNMPNSWICHNEEIVKKYNQDKLCQYDYTVNGYENIVRLMIDIYNPQIYEKYNLELPIHFIAGSDDPVITSKRDWEKAQTFLKNLGYTNMTSKLYENMSHEILNEVDNKTVYQDVLNWIEKVV